MSRKISTERLLKAGFLLTQCEDGKFWAIAREAGPEADQLAALCRTSIEDMEAGPVAEDIVLQCDADFQNPSFYMDGFLWLLEKRDFARLVSLLIKKKFGAPSPEATP